MELSELLSKAKGLPEPHQRCVAAILGALVADAAAQPIHWIYKDEVLTDVLAKADNPEFISPSANPFYCIPTGSQSMYGDQLLVMLESLVACKGFDADDNAKRIFKEFGPGSAYDNSLAAKTHSEGVKEKSAYPIKGKWQTFVLRRFAECYLQGKSVEDLPEDDQNLDPDNIIRLVSLVALYAGKAEMLEKAEEASMQMQSSDMIITVVLAACRVMEQYILNGGMQHSGPILKVMEDLRSRDRLCPQSLDGAVAGHMQAALDSRHLSVDEAARKFGKA